MDNKFDQLGVASLFFGCPGHARKTDDRRHPTLPGRAAGDSAAEPIIRELLGRAVGRLRLLCATLLYKSYPRLTRPPLNLETDELLGGVVAGLVTALRTTRPPTVRRFFALANQHMRWQLNDLAAAG